MGVGMDMTVGRDVEEGVISGGGVEMRVTVGGGIAPGVQPTKSDPMHNPRIILFNIVVTL
jgi:hypothetical protein